MLRSALNAGRRGSNLSRGERQVQVQEDLGQIFSVRRCEEGTYTEEGTHTCRNKGKCQGSQVSRVSLKLTEK